MKSTVTFLLARRLDDPKSGNSQYLRHFFDLILQNPASIKLAMAPRRSFGNLPWMTIDRIVLDRVDSIFWPQAIRIKNTFVSISPVVWIRFFLRLIFLATNVMKGDRHRRPLSLLGKELSKKETYQLARLSEKIGSDTVIAEYSSLGPVLGLIKACRKGVFLHDLFSLRAKSFREKGRVPDHHEITVDQEIIRCAPADVLFHASRSELEFLAPSMPDLNHLWVRPEVKRYELEASTTGSVETARAVFVGVRHGGNKDALQHLLEDIWPLVREMKTDAELWIAGSICQDVPETQHQGQGISLLGRVESLSAVGGANNIGLAPTRIASGVSIKVAEYIALGMPTVTLESSLTGFGTALDDLVVRVSDAEQFAKEIVELFDAPSRRLNLSKTGLEKIGERLDNSEIIAEFRGRPL